MADGLYNWETKEAYLQQFPEDRRKPSDSYLRRLDDVEKQFDVDIYNADKIQTTAMLDVLLVLSNITNQSILYVVKNYVDWAISSQVSHQLVNHVSAYTLHHSYLQVVHNYFLDYRELHSYLEENFRDDKANSVDLFHKNYLELLYVGVTSDEIVELRREALNTETGVLLVCDRRYSLPKPLLQRIELDSSLLAYQVERGGFVYQRVKQQTGYLLAASGDRTKLRSLVAKRLVILKAERGGDGYEKRMTMDNIYVAGCFDRASKQPPGTDEVYLKEEYARVKKIAEKATTGLIQNYRDWRKARP